MSAASWDSVIFDVGRDTLQRVPTMEPLRGTKAHVGALLDRCPRAVDLLDALAGAELTARRVRLPGQCTCERLRADRLADIGSECRLTRRSHGKHRRWGPGSARPSAAASPMRWPPRTKRQSDVQERHEKLADDVDALLDDIDEVLEENAEEFVRGYIQKGGQ